MKTSRNSTDGFVPRRSGRSVLGAKEAQKIETNLGHRRKKNLASEDLHSGDLNEEKHLKTPAKHGENLKRSIGKSLEAIDEAGAETPRQRRKKSQKKRRKIKLASIIMAGILLVIGGWILYKTLIASGRIFANGNLFDLFYQQPLKKDKYGRSNILIVGSTDDDPDHPGSTLTDSMMVLSVHQDKKDAYMFSIPRDLYVQFDRACLSGYAGKINEYYGCVSEGDSKEAEQSRMDGSRKFIGDIFGMDIQYTAHINTMVVRDAVNAVGGVTVDVQSRDPRGVLDGSVDWMCRVPELNAEQRQKRCPTGHYIDFKNGPNKMDGDKAMWFSRARGLAPPTYGLEQSNFDREKNQQLVLMALKDKATSTGTLTNIGKVMGLMDAMGDNLRTNINPKEVRTVINLASKIEEQNIHRLNFVEKDKELMTTGTAPTGASIVQPSAGLYDYSQVRSYIKKTIFATPVSKEAAKVVVLNGGSTSGIAAEKAKELSDLGMDIIHTDNAPDSAEGQGNKVYQIAPEDQKTATRAKLEEIVGADATHSSPGFAFAEGADFVIIVGAF